MIESSAALGPHAPISVSAAWVTNDASNHRIGLVAVRQLTQDPDRGRHVRFWHIAYEYPSLSDVLETYTRLKEAATTLLLSADHGPTRSMYYPDPDGNTVELLVDNFADWEQSGHFMRTALDFAARPMGTYLDMDSQRRARGRCVAQRDPLPRLHR